MRFKSRLLSIGQAAKMLGVHTNTLRSWADKGLIEHVRLPSGYRRFHVEDIKRMQEEMGMTVDERLDDA